MKSFYFNEKGIFDYAILKSNLQKGKKNFVILDSDKIIQVLSVVNNLLKLKKAVYQIVIDNETDHFLATQFGRRRSILSNHLSVFRKVGGFPE